MNKDEAKNIVISYWLQMSREALESARSELAAGRYNFAVNRVYYSCFYCVSAVLLKRGHRFVRHSGVRDALHCHLVNPGELDPNWGHFYDRLFMNRQRGDYKELTKFEAAQVSKMLEEAEGFVREMERLLNV